MSSTFTEQMDDVFQRLDELAPLRTCCRLSVDRRDLISRCLADWEPPLGWDGWPVRRQRQIRQHLACDAALALWPNYFQNGEPGWFSVKLPTKSMTLPKDAAPTGWLYVLEFLGPRHQYVMFGRTNDLMRRFDEHVLDANPHGFAVVNGWASRRFQDPKVLPTAEQALLVAAERWFKTSHHHERFYNVSFDKGVQAARMMMGWCIAYGG